MKDMKNPLKIIQAWNLKREQEKLNKEFEKNGLTDEVLEKQIEINEKRNKLNIPDESEFVNGEFVQ